MSGQFAHLCNVQQGSCRKITYVNIFVKRLYLARLLNADLYLFNEWDTILRK